MQSERPSCHTLGMGVLISQGEGTQSVPPPISLAHGDWDKRSPGTLMPTSSPCRTGWSGAEVRLP